MPEVLPISEAVLEVLSNDGGKRYVRVTQTPFLIGRGAETGNHLQLNDRRISRTCAAIVSEANKFYIEDRGQRRGLYVNGEKTESRELQDGDRITFGLEDSYEIVYRSADSAGDEAIPMFLTRIEHMTSAEKWRDTFAAGKPFAEPDCDSNGFEAASGGDHGRFGAGRNGFASSAEHRGARSARCRGDSAIFRDARKFG